MCKGNLYNLQLTVGANGLKSIDIVLNTSDYLPYLRSVIIGLTVFKSTAEKKNPTAVSKVECNVLGMINLIAVLRILVNFGSVPRQKGTVRPHWHPTYTFWMRNKRVTGFDSHT